MADYEQAVFISYAWGGEREDIVNEIDETLQQRGIRIVRDKRALGYRGSIKEFMERIGRGSCIIVVISDKYLRSPNCMFELVEIADNKQFHDRIFPVVLSDANIYDPLKRIEYIKFWEGKRKELAKDMKTLDPANLHGIREEMDDYDRIREKISGLTSILKDMNTLTPDMHRDSEFSNLYDAIIERLGESTEESADGSDRAAAQKAEEARAEAERKAKEEADRIARAEVNRLAARKAEADNLAAQKVEEERVASAKADREAKEETDRIAVHKAEADRKAKAEADRLAGKKAVDERLAQQKAEEERKAKEKVIPVASVAPVQKKPASKGLMYGIGAVVVLAVIGIAVLGIGFNMLTGGNKDTPTATFTAQAAVAAPATEASVTPTTAPTITPSPVPTLGIGSSMISDKDDMTLLYVPAGEFTMGSNDGGADEQPVHKATLDAFWIDQTEVTNKMYSLCVATSACQLPTEVHSYSRSSYYGDSQYDNYPVIYVDWNMAKTYCEWAGRQLPTEAQWEKAARGTDANTYPWGNTAPDKDLLNYNSKDGDTTKVGSYETGKSFYGAYDLAGNVWEWVNDWYSDTYYQGSPSSNPSGPDSGQYRVLRGGAWDFNKNYVRSAYRYGNNPTNTSDNIIGFRCASSP